MDLGGVVGMEGVVSAASSEFGGLFSSPPVSSHSELKQRGVSCSGGRSGGFEENEWRFSKMARTEAMLAPSITRGADPLHRSNSHSLFPEGGQMLSFSSSPSSKPDALALTSDGTLPYYHHPSSSSSTPSYLRNAGLGSGCVNVNMDGVFLSRVRGPFTPSQWMELEQQALIYKHIDANVPIPHSLLISIRRSLKPGFSPISAGSFGSSALGWGSFHLGYSGNVDSEPGRCRRTDGKKWRCSRDAVADQKYCERHMNRGRHRSRKHVEGHTGHAAKAIPIIPTSQSASAVSAGRSSSSLTIMQQQTKNLQSNATDPCPAQLNRMLISKENVNDHVQDSQDLSTLNSMNSKPMNTLFPISKQQDPFEVDSSQGDFGHITTEIILNPSRSSTQKFSFIPTPKLSDQRPKCHPLRHFVDDWPKNQSDRSTIMWPDVEEMQSDRTQLSISIPMASSAFSSSSSSPNHEKLTLSPLKLSRDFDPIHMGLGVGGVLNEVTQRQASWTPISWEASMAGPLGEALTNASSTPKDQSKNCSSSSLNLLTDGWDSSPWLESSPTGVLQKTNFRSLSSSTGSSPRAESHKTHNSTGSLCDDLLGSNLLDPPNIPSL
ncbi:growth-regulating factor 6 [Elaeis guineensis]|uniref:Growth-regulating factor n=1 Tax=Elaeis guineensis var. tenera TaxID=51953 RepID=A0A6I9SGU1_ELAGV|nr:growth-regulating factor 6 [Elaeis guineensis]